jgi:hypothetical protein
LIGTLRRECLDQMLIFGEAQLRRVLSAYAAYWDRRRLQDNPLARAGTMQGVLVC